MEEVPKEEEQQQQQQGHGDEMRSQASSPAPWQQHQHGGASEEEEEKDSLAAVLHHLLPPSVTNEAAGQQGDSGSDAAATPATHNAEAGSSGGGGDGRGVGPDLLALLRRRLPSLLCPLTGQAFADPVVAADECVYERAAIERSLYQCVQQGVGRREPCWRLGSAAGGRAVACLHTCTLCNACKALCACTPLETPSLLWQLLAGRGTTRRRSRMCRCSTRC